MPKFRHRPPTAAITIHVRIKPRRHLICICGLLYPFASLRVILKPALRAPRKFASNFQLPGRVLFAHMDLKRVVVTTLSSSPYMRLPRVVVLAPLAILQGGVDHALPAPCNGARSPDPTVNHFLRWLPHRCDGGAGQSERCRFIKWRGPHFLLECLCHALDHGAHWPCSAGSVSGSGR